MNDPTERYHNALAAALVLGFVSQKAKNKKSKTKCQQKKHVSLRRTMDSPELGYTLRQVSRFKFIKTQPPGPFLIDIKNTVAFIEPIHKESKIGRKYA